MVIYCKTCGREFAPEEAVPYEVPGPRWATGWDIDHEGEPTCPYCGSLRVIEIFGDDYYDER